MIKNLMAKALYVVMLAAALSIGTFAQSRPIVKQTQPVYPEMARRMRVAGKVVVKVVIGADGKVKSASVVSGHPLLAQAATNAVKGWVYAAGAEETKNVELSFTM